MDYRLIELFKVATPVKKGRKKNPIELNKIAVKFGYIIHPDVCNKFTEEFLQHQTVDYNSTFYKKWDSVKNDSERLIDQLTHYACAYTLDKTWVPEVECEIPEYRSYTVIMPCTEEALLGKCMEK